ncbi:MAG: hypothetical protein LBQ52_07925 [Helicobacteraceae bacterium]|jgi:hypothetical protein|nr:hypothetical protein [Helicobacteraceae bacterium]
MPKCILFYALSLAVVIAIMGVCGYFAGFHITSVNGASIARANHRVFILAYVVTLAAILFPSKLFADRYKRPPSVRQKIIFAIGVLSVNVAFLAIGAYAVGRDPLVDFHYLMDKAPIRLYFIITTIALTAPVAYYVFGPFANSFVAERLKKDILRLTYGDELAKKVLKVGAKNAAKQERERLKTRLFFWRRKRAE